MSKALQHKQDLAALFDVFFATGDPSALNSYLLAHSSLPGRRANLELADAFGDLVAEREASGIEGQSGLWDLCITLATISAIEAPVNSSEEFLSFCGAVGIGAIGSISREDADEALEILGTLANDPRWRMREAVCFGLQRMLAKHASFTLPALYEWVSDRDCLQMRAAAAAVAEPMLLKDEAMAQSALDIHRRILQWVMGAPECRSEAFKTLRKALGYTLSVVVQALPTEGFNYLAQLAKSGDAEIVWIVKQNLKKNRLAKYFPEQVDAIWHLLSLNSASGSSQVTSPS